MRTFEVKFEFFGKHMKTKVKAIDETHAKRVVAERLNIISVEPEKYVDVDKFSEFLSDNPESKKIFDQFMDIFNFGKK